jgi:hypothetical protein
MIRELAMSWQYTSHNPTDLSTLLDHVIAPVPAGIWKPMGRPPNPYTRIERDCDTLRADMRILFNDPSSTAAQTTNLSIRKRKLTITRNLSMERWW